MEVGSFTVFSRKDVSLLISSNSHFVTDEFEVVFGFLTCLTLTDVMRLRLLRDNALLTASNYTFSSRPSLTGQKPRLSFASLFGPSKQKISLLNGLYSV